MNSTYAPNYLEFFKGSSWGIHICHFYRNQEELLEVLIPYFAEGLRDNEACIWIVSNPLTLENAWQIIAASFPALEEIEKKGQFEFISYKDFYIEDSGNVKEIDKILQQWNEKENNALNKGFKGIRVTGAVNFIKNRSDWKDFMDYECFICENLYPHRIKAICSYPLLGTEDLMHVADVVLNHQAILSKRDGEWHFAENPQNKVTRQLKEQEEKLTRLTEKLYASNEELTHFAFVASHDLKEPIRMVSCFTGMLEKKYKDQLDEDGLKYLQFSKNGAKRAYELINNLLEYAKLNQENIVKQIVDCNKVLETVLDNLNLKIEENNVEITSDLLPEIEGSEVLIRQLFQNLISNGIKFSKNKTPSIKISSQIKEDSVIICFKDDGIGIAKDFIPDLFTVFKKYHNRTEYEGDGIGLAICKKIVEKHDGKIWVETVEGNGSSFYIEFPVNNKQLKQKKIWQNLLKNPSGKEHIAQIYNDRNALAEMVVYYASHGINNKEGVIIAAREENIKLFNHRLKQNYIDIEKYISKGQLIFISAENAKQSIMKDNEPSRENFEYSIGKIIHDLKLKFPEIRVYGEIVDILAADGNVKAAIALENFWNDLIEKYSFRLFCAYRQRNLKNLSGADINIETICCQHTSLIPSTLSVE